MGATGELSMGWWSKLTQKKKTQTTKSAKELATERGEPWVEVLGMDIGTSATEGSFELDWNHYFVEQLRKEGYQGQTEIDVVDNWFRNVCRHVVLETYEQDVATNKYIDKTDIGNGRTVVK
jgi:hypothetical protein